MCVCVPASFFTQLLNLNRHSLFPIGSSRGHPLSWPVPSLRAARSQRTSDGAVQPSGERGRYCAASAWPAGWRRRLLLSSPAFASAALSGCARELGFDKRLHQGAAGGSRRVSARGRQRRRRANNFGRVRPEVFLQKNKLVGRKSNT